MNFSFLNAQSNDELLQIAKNQQLREMEAICAVVTLKSISNGASFEANHTELESNQLLGKIVSIKATKAFTLDNEDVSEAVVNDMTAYFRLTPGHTKAIKKQANQVGRTRTANAIIIDVKAYVRYEITSSLNGSGKPVINFEVMDIESVLAGQAQNISAAELKAGFRETIEENKAQQTESLARSRSNRMAMMNQGKGKAADAMTVATTGTNMVPSEEAVTA